MPGRLAGKVAIVTGAAGGIGRATAVALAEQGAAVVVNDVGANVDGTGADKGAIDTVIEAIEGVGGKAVGNTDSVGTMDGAEALVRTATGEFGRLDLLVNCAGNAVEALPWDMTEDEWDRTINIHLKGHFACMRAASAPMREQNSGSIVAITSHVGLYGLPTSANYCAAKAGVTGLVKSFALALQPFGVSVNAVAPSAVSRMSDTVTVEVLKERAAAMGVELPADITEGQLRMLLIGDPAAVANFIAYLGADDARSITGQIFAVIGGHIGVFGAWTETASLDKLGTWTVDELATQVPATLAPTFAPASPMG